MIKLKMNRKLYVIYIIFFIVLTFIFLRNQLTGQSVTSVSPDGAIIVELLPKELGEGSRVTRITVDRNSSPVSNSAVGLKSISTTIIFAENYTINWRGNLSFSVMSPSQELLRFNIGPTDIVCEFGCGSIDSKN